MIWRRKSLIRDLWQTRSTCLRWTVATRSRSSSKLPKGSRNKYAFDPEQRIFSLKKVLPAGMTFPYDFGFVPSTKAEDGDPTDVLVLMDEPAFPGCLLKCRIIGIIEGKKKRGERNDRIIAIEEANHSYAHVRHVKELGKKFVQELEEFFVNYHALDGEEYKVLQVKGPS